MCLEQTHPSMGASEPTTPLTRPENNNQKRNESLNKLCWSTNELSLSSRSSCVPLHEFAEDSAHLFQTKNQPLTLLRNISIETNMPQGVQSSYPYETLRSNQPFLDCRNNQDFFVSQSFPAFPFERQLLLSSTLDLNLLNSGFDLEHTTTFGDERGCESE